MEQSNFRKSWEKIAGNLENLDQTANVLQGPILIVVYFYWLATSLFL